RPASSTPMIARKPMASAQRSRSGSEISKGGSGLGALLFDARRLPGEVAEVVELGPPDLTVGDHLDAVDLRRVQREDPLHADPVGDLAHGEGGSRPSLAEADHVAFEDLDALFFALFDPDVDPKPVTGAEARDILADLCLFNLVDDIHGDPPGWRQNPA